MKGENVVKDPETAKGLFHLGSELSIKLQELNCDYFQHRIREFAKKDPS